MAHWVKADLESGEEDSHASSVQGMDWGSPGGSSVALYDSPARKWYADYTCCSDAGSANYSPRS